LTTKLAVLREPDQKLCVFIEKVFVFCLIFVSKYFTLAFSSGNVKLILTLARTSYFSEHIFIIFVGFTKQQLFCMFSTDFLVKRCRYLNIFLKKN